MNREQRRAANRQRSKARIADLWRHIDQTGRPGIIHGLHSACSDCDATGSFILTPDHQVIARVFHDTSCPAYLGVVNWAPVPLEGEHPDA